MAKHPPIEFIIQQSDGSTRRIWLIGRNAWALRTLIERGNKGVTPIDTPAPRWSAYIYYLRKNSGLLIETKYEKHGGPFAGEHARYIPKGSVICVDDVEFAA